MSQLRIRAKNFKEFKLNVVSFMSPIFASTTSSQTQSSEQHHPIRTQQPNIRFDVVWRSQQEFERWQTFVRNIQKKLIKGKDPNDVAKLTLWWPERNILNWEGLIKETEGGAERFQWAPHSVVEVELTKGLVSEGAAWAFSYGSDFNEIFGGIRNTIPSADRLLTAPPGGLGGSAGTTPFQSPQSSNPGISPTPSATGPGGSLSSLFGVIS